MLDYLKSTRHPLPNVLFVLPLLAVYEGGVLLLGGETPDDLRNGADAFVRSQLTQLGVTFPWVTPLAVVLVLVVWSAIKWGERPKEILKSYFGMAVESIVFGVGIWALSRNFRPLLELAGLPLNSIEFQPLAAGHTVKFIGAGVYEEFLFRLGLFGLLFLLFRVALLPKAVAVVLAAAASAAAFAYAHHIGPAGEPLTTPVFLFRTVAGLIFTSLFASRGLGVAVGAHAGYNILVGVAVG